MSLILNVKLARNKKQLRIMNEQWAEVHATRCGSSLAAMEAFIAMTGNAAQSPAEAYREFDRTTKIELVPAGEHATLSRILQNPRSVSIGRLAFEYRQSSDVDVGQTSMGGQLGVKMNHVDYTYAGTPIPIHDIGYGIEWRVMESMNADNFDSTVDNSRESERKLLTTMDNYMWDGDAGINIKGRTWLGIKNDPTVVNTTLTVDLSSSVATPDDIRNEVARVRDILRITNNCGNDLEFGVSREILSNWERPFSNAEGTFGTIKTMITGNPDNPASGLRGLKEVYEDSRLFGNQITMYWNDQMGFHSVVGMGMSSYAVPRQFHNSDFNFIKWAAAGFLAKTDLSNRKCALYAE